MGTEFALRPAADLGRIERAIGHTDSHAEVGRAGARQIRAQAMPEQQQAALSMRCQAACTA